MGRPAPRSKEQPRRAPGVDDMETQVGGERTLRVEQPLAMEQLSQDFDFVHYLYLTTLPAACPALLTVGNVRDGPQVFLDGQPVGGRQCTAPALDEGPATSSSRPTASSH